VESDITHKRNNSLCLFSSREMIHFLISSFFHPQLTFENHY
jgi:hypothetical protein